MKVMSLKLTSQLAIGKVLNLNCSFIPKALKFFSIFPRSCW